MGGLTGVPNFLSRLAGGILLDKFRFNRFMPVAGLFLTVILITIFYVVKVSFFGMVVCLFFIYFLSFIHFSTIPAEVLLLFPGPQNSVAQGAVGLADSFAYAGLAIINTLV